MQRDYSAFDLDEPRRIQMLDEAGEVERVIWASINFCFEYFDNPDQWEVEPPAEVPDA